jgi:hypothetical protein
MHQQKVHLRIRGIYITCLRVQQYVKYILAVLVHLQVPSLHHSKRHFLVRAGKLGKNI